MSGLAGPPFSIEEVRSWGKSFIWPQKWRPVDNACGREIDGPELLGTVAAALFLIALSWMSRKMRVIFSSLFGASAGIYMAVLAFHLLTLADAPYNGEFFFCAELFLFRILPLFPAGFFSVMVKCGAAHGTVQKAFAALVLLALTVVVYVSVSIGHQADHAKDHRIWWLFGAQMAVPLIIGWQVLKLLLWAVGFGRETSAPVNGRHGRARRASINRVLSGHPVHMKDPPRRLSVEEGAELQPSRRSAVRRSSITRAMGIQSPGTGDDHTPHHALVEEVDPSRRGRARRNSIERVLG
mmetsp:Transcript_36431/g.89722  ORF Transcript_36431/g.89722 Transcript_36431/m.89722 type:complete len:296 (+) Transcript_36431:106-993(+)